MQLRWPLLVDSVIKDAQLPVAQILPAASTPAPPAASKPCLARRSNNLSPCGRCNCCQHFASKLYQDKEIVEEPLDRARQRQVERWLGELEAETRAVKAAGFDCVDVWAESWHDQRLVVDGSRLGKGSEIGFDWSWTAQDWAEWSEGTGGQWSEQEWAEWWQDQDIGPSEQTQDKVSKRAWRDVFGTDGGYAGYMANCDGSSPGDPSGKWLTARLARTRTVGNSSKQPRVIAGVWRGAQGHEHARVRNYRRS